MAKDDSSISKPFGLATFEFEKGRWHLRRKKEPPRRGICYTTYCVRARCPDRVVCATCNSRQWRANNPAHYAFNNLKVHAKERGIPFDLTRDEFMFFCANNFYLQFRGRRAKHLQIDRIRNKEGYKIGNIQVLTCSENSSKRHHTDYPF